MRTGSRIGHRARSAPTEIVPSAVAVSTSERLTAPCPSSVWASTATPTVQTPVMIAVPAASIAIATLRPARERSASKPSPIETGASREAVVRGRRTRRSSAADTKNETPFTAKNEQIETMASSSAASARPATMSVLLVVMTRPFARWTSLRPTSAGTDAPNAGTK